MYPKPYPNVSRVKNLDTVCVSKCIHNNHFGYGFGYSLSPYKVRLYINLYPMYPIIYIK